MALSPPVGRLGTIFGYTAVVGVLGAAAPITAISMYDHSINRDNDLVVGAVFGVPMGGMVGAVAGGFVGYGYNAAKVSVASLGLRVQVPRNVPTEFQGLREDTVQQIRTLRRDLTPMIGAVNNARWGQITANIELLRAVAR
jgi:hypothetical protein